MHKKIQKTIAVLLTAAAISTATLSTSISVNAAYPTGIGLSAHAVNAYVERWNYVWGGTEYGNVDCSGLIATYYGVGGVRTDMLASSPTSGLVSEGIPRIHGLGLYQPGHVGIYIGSNAAIDARSVSQGVCYQNAYSKGWTHWFKVVGVGYPSEGFVRFNGHAFYYENGEYVINCTREINGETYSFDQFGYANHMPPDEVYKMTDYYDQQAYERNRAEKKAEQAAEQKKLEEKKKEKEEQEKRQKAIAEKRKKTIENTKYCLSAGSTGPAVKEIQSILFEQGYLNNYPEGYYDKQTEKAIKQFQSDNDLKITGQTNNNTYKLLKEGPIITNTENENPLLKIFMKYAVPKDLSETVILKINNDSKK